MMVLLAVSQPPPPPLLKHLKNNLEINTRDLIPGISAKVPPSCNVEAGQTTSAGQNAAKTAALMAIQQIPLTLATTSDLPTLINSSGVSEARAQVGVSVLTKKKEISGVRPVSQDTNQSQVSMLEKGIHSPSPALYYHSD